MDQSTAPAARRGRALRSLAVVAVTLAATWVALRSLSGQTGYVRIADDQIGLETNYLTGESRLLDVPGDHLFVPLLFGVQVFPRGPVEYVLAGNESATVARGPRLLVRASDGSSYSFERVVTRYALDLDRLTQTLSTLGLDRQATFRVVGGFVRPILQEAFGTLSVEQVLLSDGRESALKQARERLAEVLQPYGLKVLSLTVGSPSFPKAYSDTLERRKVAQEDSETMLTRARQLEAGMSQSLEQLERERSLKELAQREELLSKLEKAQVDALLRRADADKQLAEKRLDGTVERDQRLMLARTMQASLEHEVSALRRKTAALEAHGSFAVRAALAERMEDVKIELAPQTAPASGN